jgi:aminoglycoside phosphotransferase (APT) family kinase protein
MNGDQDLVERVSSRFAMHPLYAVVSAVERLPGGHSGLTYRVTAGDRVYVVKATPPGRPAIGRHDVARQARVLHALRPTNVPVPALIVEDHEQPPWFAMEWIAGDAIEPVLDGIALPTGIARSRMLAAIDVLARLHRVDVHLTGVQPISLREELTKWTAVLGAGAAEFVSGGETFAAALERDLPAGAAPALIHGDFRLGNILFRDTTPQAVIDWEIWSVGDPRIDLGYFALFADADNFPELGAAVPGLPDADEIDDCYGAANGRPVQDSNWFAALGRYRMAAIMAHNLRRHREGRHEDESQETLPPTIRRLTESGLALLGAASR